MKKTLVVLGFAAYLAASFGSAVCANELVNITPIEPTVGENGQRVISMPDKKKTSRRRMLFDFGLFGAGVHVGWLKPKNAVLQEGDGGETVVKHRRGVGMPIFNVSAGTHALGLGTK
ncbi:MAG TPA: hypothetical protein V6D22_19150 [Candidatus Obscuribacterales bacterium]